MIENPVDEFPSFEVKTFLKKIGFELSEMRKISPSDDDYYLRLRKIKSVSATVQPQKEGATEADLSLGDLYSNGKLNSGYLLKNAEILREAKETALAKKIYQTLLKSGETTATSFFGMAVCLEEEGSFESAIEHYEESLAYQPDLKVYQKLISLFSKLGRDSSAYHAVDRAFYVKGLTSNQLYDLYLSKGNFATRLDYFPQAEKAFNDAIRIRPESEECRTNLGIVYLKMRRVEDAKRCFEDVIASNVSHSTAWFGMAQCHQEQRNELAAELAYERTLELDPTHSGALSAVIRYANQSKRYDAVEKILSQVVGRIPANANLLTCLAGIQYHQKRRGECLKTLNAVLSMKPDHKGANTLLEKLKA